MNRQFLAAWLVFPQRRHAPLGSDGVDCLDCLVDCLGPEDGGYFLSPTLNTGVVEGKSMEP